MSISYLLVLIIFLQTVFTAREELEETVCENETAELNCRKGYTINITSAIFGRKDKRICRLRNGTSPDNCEASNTLSIMLEKCNQTQSCRVEATKNLFGNPCNYFSYLKVTYNCVRNFGIWTVLGCEHSTVDIQCDAGKKIKIVNVLYGRKNQLKCHPTLESINAGIESNRCDSPKAMQVMETKCNNFENCSVIVESSEFKDEVCTTTFKYLEADVLCT